MAPTTIKTMFGYGEQRRTLFLNAHNKDDYGRHRAHVLYGFDLSGSGTVVTVSPGAVYTSQGQRLFVEVTDRVIDIGPSSVDAFNSVLYPSYPICVLLYLNYQFATPQIPLMTDNAPSGPTAMQLRCRLVPYDKDTCAPAYNLLPRDPVNLDTLQPSGYPHISNALKPSIDVISGHNASAESIQFGEIPIGYVLIGANPTTNAVATSLTSPGVSLITYSNAFETVSDIIGADVLLPLQSVRVVAGLSNAAGSALRQGYTTNAVGSATSPQLLHPQYGTPEGLRDGTSSHATYRDSSFYRDGDSILESMRRSDVVLRQWMNRTGAQDLISITKDASGNIIPQFSPLDVVLRKMDGSLSAATPSVDGNANTVVYDNGVSVSTVNPNNHVIKSGLIPHVENSLLGIQGTTEGDSHEKAIAALDVGLWNVMTNVLGVTTPRAQLRDATGGTFTPLNLNEAPGGLPTQTVPTYSVAVSPYLTTQNISQQLAELTYRSLDGTGENLLGNQTLGVSSLASGTQASPPPNWGFYAGTATWARTLYGNGIYGTLITLTGGFFGQDVTETGNALAQAFETSRYISFSAIIVNSGAQNLQVALIGFSDNSFTTMSFSVTSASIPSGSSTMKMVTGTAKVPPGTTVHGLRLIISAAGGGTATGAFTFLGASVNTGMPKSPLTRSRMMGDVMSLYDNQDLPRRGALWMGDGSTNFQVKQALNATDPQDLTTLSQVTSMISGSGFLPTTGGTMSGAIHMGTHQIDGLADPTDPQGAVTVSYMGTAITTALGPYSTTTAMNSAISSALSTYTTSVLNPALANYLPLAGGNLTGALDLGSHQIHSVTDPTNPQDAATKNYVDTFGRSTATTAGQKTNVSYSGYIRPVGSTNPQADIYCNVAITVTIGQTAALLDTTFTGLYGITAPSTPPLAGQTMVLEILNTNGVAWILSIGGDSSIVGPNPTPAPNQYSLLSGDQPANISSSSVGYIRLVFRAIVASTTAPSGSFSATRVCWELVSYST